MSPRAWPDRVRDILTAIHEIESFIDGMAFDDFREDAKTLKAVLANFASSERPLAMFLMTCAWRTPTSHGNP